MHPKEAIALLERTPAALAALLGGLPDAWLQCDEGPATFSPHEVIGHLLHGERTDWLPRIHRLLEHGEALAFEPFDRFGHRTYPERTTRELLDEFAALRSGNLVELRGLVRDDELLERRGLHPALGVVTLRQMLSTWVVHDLTHIAQIARVMARRYGDEVGPWSEYLGVLQWRR